ncbi:DUF2242 domain-containing protein [Acidovorax sp. HDW3]|uniref:DUF2242 domain-containing protein n=1 Tax=Acidovorax sp. HDW3 TaxID=2714923 RepID=UPI001407951E|nr:DUF2242 domain-containing protein [Acidovorax sp. HDW3]QIL43860.1 DUF2242 domain-containing protein [Acidovorax sp. HDW3]
MTVQGIGRLARAGLALALGMVLAGCFRQQVAPLKKFEPEVFNAAANFSRHYETAPAQACEAARRVLLGQGYVISAATDAEVTGRKFYQPQAESHVALELRVVCALQAGDAAVVYAAAIQDIYSLRKGKESASLGVGGLGSLSLPLDGGSDGMVKTGTQTVTEARFYRSFFDLLDEQLAQQ